MLTPLSDIFREDFVMNTSIRAFWRHALVGRFGNARWCTESRPDTVFLSTINTLVGAVFKAPQRSVFEYTVEQAVHKLLWKAHIKDAMATRTIDAPTFTLSVTVFVKWEAEKCSPVQAQIKKEHKRLVETVDKLKAREK